MATEHIMEITALLVQTNKAHGAYEDHDLNGVFDQAWPTWYARYAVDNGIGSLVGHSVVADWLAHFLASSNVDFERDKPAESWAEYTARRIVQEF